MDPLEDKLARDVWEKFVLEIRTPHAARAIVDYVCEQAFTTPTQRIRDLEAQADELLKRIADFEKRATPFELSDLERQAVDLTRGLASGDTGIALTRVHAALDRAQKTLAPATRAITMADAERVERRFDANMSDDNPDHTSDEVEAMFGALVHVWPGGVPVLEHSAEYLKGLLQRAEDECAQHKARISELENQLRAGPQEAAYDAGFAAGQLAQRADSGAEVSDEELQEAWDVLHQDSPPTRRARLRKALRCFIAARRGVAQQPAFALTADEHASHEHLRNASGSSEPFQKVVTASLRRVVAAIDRALAAAPAPEQHPAADFDKPAIAVAKYRETFDDAPESVRVILRRTVFAQRVCELADTLRLTAPAAIEPLSEDDRNALAEAIHSMEGAPVYQDALRSLYDRLCGYGPAAPAVKAERDYLADAEALLEMGAKMVDAETVRNLVAMVRRAEGGDRGE